MNLQKIKDKGLGCFLIYWVSGGVSDASIGMKSNGERWIAPSNWIEPADLTEEIANSIYEIEIVKPVVDAKKVRWLKETRRSLKLDLLNESLAKLNENDIDRLGIDREELFQSIEDNYGAKDD